MKERFNVEKTRRRKQIEINISHMACKTSSPFEIAVHLDIHTKKKWQSESFHFMIQIQQSSRNEIHLSEKKKKLKSGRKKKYILETTKNIELNY